MGVTPGQLRYARAGLHHRIHSPGSRDVKGYQPAFSEVVPAGRAKTVEISAFLCSKSLKVRKRLTFEAVVVVFGVLPTAASRGRSGERGRRPETCTSQITPPMETG